MLHNASLPSSSLPQTVSSTMSLFDVFQLDPLAIRRHAWEFYAATSQSGEFLIAPNPKIAYGVYETQMHHFGRRSMRGILTFCYPVCEHEAREFVHPQASLTPTDHVGLAVLYYSKGGLTDDQWKKIGNQNGPLYAPGGPTLTHIGKRENITYDVPPPYFFKMMEDDNEHFIAMVLETREKTAVVPQKQNY